VVGAEGRKDGGFKFLKRKYIRPSYGPFRASNWLK